MGKHYENQYTPTMLTIISHENIRVVGEAGLGERGTAAGMLARCLQVDHRANSPTAQYVIIVIGMIATFEITITTTMI